MLKCICCVQVWGGGDTKGQSLLLILGGQLLIGFQLTQKARLSGQQANRGLPVSASQDLEF